MNGCLPTSCIPCTLEQSLEGLNNLFIVDDSYGKDRIDYGECMQPTKDRPF